MPLPTPNDTHAYYARHASAYAERADRIDLAPMLLPFLERLAAPCRILDLGCGSGRDARHFARLGHHVVAADPCAALLAIAAEKRIAEPAGRLQFVAARVPELPFAGATFDAVWACASLLHVRRADLLAALAACHRVLKPGGLLSIIVKQGDGEIDDQGRLCVLWRTEALCGQVEAAGFSVDLAVPRASFDARDITWLQVLARA